MKGTRAMRFKALLALAFLGTATLFAQKGVEDGSRFGHGQDSIDCLENISLYNEYLKTKNYNDAYTYWKRVFADAPVAQHSIYTNGVAILKQLAAGTKDMALRKGYADTLMMVYDQQLQYLDKLNLLRQNPWTDFFVKGEKAHTYITYYPRMDNNKAYEMLKEAIDLGKDRNQYYIIGDFMKISANKCKADTTHREQFVQDYLLSAELIATIADKVQNAATPNPKLVEAVNTTKENIDAYFIGSGAADCQQLEAIYGPKVEENKENLDYLKKVVGVMHMLKCTESDVYFAASEYAHAIAPTAESAVGCAHRYLKRDDMDKALAFFEEAISLDSSDVKKADHYYTMASIYSAKNQYSKARSLCNQSLSLNPNKGENYILIARMYAQSTKWSDEQLKNQCTYFLVIDKLNQAKRVSPELAEEVNKQIATYKQHTPEAADLFMLGLKQGDAIKIEGWINETTTIR